MAKNMSKTMKPLQWNKKYSLDDTAIDQQQKKMFDLFNELLSACEDKAEKNIPNTVNSLNDHVKLFFSTEEKILKSNGYPDYETHVKRHRKFIRAVVELRRKISDTPENLESKDVQGLRELFITHIEATVRECLPFLRIQAYINEQKK